MTKSIKTIIGATVLMHLFMFIPAFADSGTFTLTFFVGDVSTKLNPEDNWQQAELKQNLKKESEIKTGIESRAELVTDNNSVLRVGENSHYLIEQLKSGDSRDKTEGKLFKGRLWAKIKKVTGKESEFNTRTTTAVAAVRGTVFRMDVLQDSLTELYVYNGTVEVGGPSWAPDHGKPRKWSAPKQVEGPKEVDMEEWTEIVKAQQRLVIGPKGVVSKEEFDLEEDKTEDWVAFNLERDSIQTESEIKE